MDNKQACYNCRHRVPNASAADKCNIDGRRVEYLTAFTSWGCPYWAMDELRAEKKGGSKK